MTEHAIANAALRVRAIVVGARLDLVLDARDGARWIATLRRDDVGVGEPALGAPTAIDVGDDATGGARTLAAHVRYARATLHIAVRLRDDEPWAQVVESLALDGDALAIGRMQATWRWAAPWTDPGETWSPHLVPEAHDVIGTQALRTPGLAAQDGTLAAALVADVRSLAKRQALPPCMDFARDVDGTPLMTTGLRPHRVRGHVFFTAVDAPAKQPVFHHAYWLWTRAGAAPGAAVAEIGAFAWRAWGRGGLLASAPPPLRADEYATRMYDAVLPTRWREATVAGERVGAVKLDGSYRDDAWFSAWWNSLASAYGMRWWGERLGRADWSADALATRALALSAPDDDGLFPVIHVFAPDGGPGRWIGSSQQGGGVGVLHLMDMSWTMWWLIAFHRDLAPHPPTLARAKRYIAALARLQRADGGLPAWVEAGTRRVLTRVDAQRQADLLAADRGGDHLGFRMNGLRHWWGDERFERSAEDATSLLVAAELARALPADDADRPAIIAFAERVAHWLESFAFHDARWLDFEVAYSCAAKPHGFFDARSRQWPQNNLCLDHAARGLLALHALTGDDRWLRLGRRALDRLQLGQQLWDPPFLAIDGFGGYGVQNADAEWHDARQAQFAWTHAEWFRAEGDVAQRERAQAAVRAAFVALFDPAAAAAYPTGWFREPRGMIAENHAHGGWDETCCVSGWDWGAGSALTAAARLDALGLLPAALAPTARVRDARAGA